MIVGVALCIDKGQTITTNCLLSLTQNIFAKHSIYNYRSMSIYFDINIRSQ